MSFVFLRLHNKWSANQQYSALPPSISKQPNLCNTKEQLVQLERIPFLQLFLDDIATFNIPGDGVNLPKFSVLLLLFADVLSSSSLDLSLEFSSVSDRL